MRTEINEVDSSLKLRSVTINTLSSKKWELIKPLTITIEQKGKDNFTACFYEADIYSYSESIPDAIKDLNDLIIDQYEFLLEEVNKSNELSDMLQIQLDILSQVLSKRKY